MNRNKPTTRSRRSFLPDLLRRPVCRIFLIALLAFSQVPAAATVALAVFNQGSEHQVLVSGGTGRMSVTLRHVAHPGRHHHNLLEHFLLGSSGGDHPDHEFAFGCGETAEEAKQDAEASGEPGPGLFPNTSGSPACPRLVGAGECTRPWPARCGAAETPLALRRGTVLII